MTGTRPGLLRSRLRRSGEFPIALGLATLVLWLACACTPNGLDGTTPDAWVEIKGRHVAVEIADTPEKQSKGLGERDRLAWHHGMYFEYANPAFYAFWMKGMRFSIDIVWIRKGRIVDLDSNVPFEEGGNGPTLRPVVLIDAVLEVPAGYAAAHGWRVGDRLNFERIKAP
jgi:hypothetical protein